MSIKRLYELKMQPKLSKKKGKRQKKKAKSTAQQKTFLLLPVKGDHINLSDPNKQLC